MQAAKDVQAARPSSLMGLQCKRRQQQLEFSTKLPKASAELVDRLCHFFGEEAGKLEQGPHSSAWSVRWQTFQPNLTASCMLLRFLNVVMVQNGGESVLLLPSACVEAK